MSRDRAVGRPGQCTRHERFDSGLRILWWGNVRMGKGVILMGFESPLVLSRR
jgi:hypothetical protein